MKTKFNKTISMLLALSMLMTMISTGAAAAESTYLDQLKAVDASVTLDGTNPGTVTVAVASTGDMNVYAITGEWDVTAQESSGKIVLSELGSDVMSFSGMNYAEVSTGALMWTDDSFSAPTVLADGSRFLTATYTVAADTPAGEYTVRFLSKALCADDFETNETYTYYTAKINVVREIELSYLDQLKATDGSVTLDGTNPGTATVAVVSTGDINVYAITGEWDVAAQESSGKIVLSELGSDVMTFSGMNYAEVSTGALMWTDDTFAAPTVLADGSRFLTATYTVAADTPAGEYTVRFLSKALCADDFETDETYTYYTAKITVARDEEQTYLDQLKATDGSVTLDGTNPGTATIAVVSTGEMNVYAITGEWDVTAQESSGKIVLSELGSDVMTFSGMNYAEVSTGALMWTDDTFAAPTVLADGTRFLTATYTVAADTPAGEYTVRFLSKALCADDFETDETYTYYTAKITVARDEHNEGSTYLDQLKAADGSVTLYDGQAGEVTVALVGMTSMDVYGIQGSWDIKEQADSTYLTLSAIGSDVLTFSGMNYADVATGALMWGDDSYSAPGVVGAGTKLLTATYRVAADTPAGEYTVRFHVVSFTGTDYEPMDADTYYTAKITVELHTHVYDQTVTAPTCTTVGFTTYTCACGDTYAADEVPALGHTEVVDAAVAPTCTTTGLTEGKHCSVCSEVVVAQEVVPALGHDYQIVCTRCGEIDPDAVLDVEELGDITYTVSYAVNSRTVTVTHTIACKVGYLAGDTYVTITAIANSDGSYSFAVPEGAKNILIVVKGDVNGNGSVNATDKALMARSLLNTTHNAYLALTARQSFAADINGNGSVNATDKALMARSLLLTSHNAYQTLSW